MTGVCGTAARSHWSTRAGFVQVFPRDLSEPAKGLRVAREGIIGRSNDSDFVIADSKLSRKHARFRRMSDGIEVTDLGSRNGTFAKGQAVSANGRVVSDHELVRVGNTLLLAVPDVEPYAAPPRWIPGSIVGLSTDLVGGPVLSSVWDRTASLAKDGKPILVLGESGVGKEAIARLAHLACNPNGPFVALNAAAIPKALFEAEIFGHTRGIFTGATHGRLGAFREADGGVLFLDEIGELDLDVQAKLLRVLDDLKIRPLGGGEVAVDVLVVAATNRDLAAAVKAGQFREDLLYRLSAREVRVPPLRERPDDILLLAQSFLRAGSAPLGLSVQAAESLVLAPWPGNVRSLHRALAIAAEQARRGARHDVDIDLLPPSEVSPDAVDGPGELTAEGLRMAVALARGNVARAAAELGIGRSTFYAACRRLNVDPKSLRIR